MSQLTLAHRVERAILRERERLGGVLRELRQKRNLSQEAAAEMIGIHSKHLQRVELGSANVTISTLVAIASAYRTSLACFFSGTETAPRKAIRRKGGTVRR